MFRKEANRRGAGGEDELEQSMVTHAPDGTRELHMRSLKSKKKKNCELHIFKVCSLLSLTITTIKMMSVYINPHQPFLILFTSLLCYFFSPSSHKCVS